MSYSWEGNRGLTLRWPCVTNFNDLSTCGLIESDISTLLILF